MVGTVVLTEVLEFSITACMRMLLPFLSLTCLASISPAQKRGPMTPIVDVPDLPRVLLIGDSISIGYTLPARAALQGVANVHRISTNGGPTSKGLEHLESWVGKKKWDVIHFNWGLHDLCYRHPESKTQGKRDKLKGQVAHSVEEYAANLEELVRRLKRTKARLIFATTTPVPEGEAGRKVGDDLRYNQAALVVMKKHRVAVNDLHAVMAGKMDEFAVRPGNVHFKPEGSVLLGEHVAQAVRGALATVGKRD